MCVREDATCEYATGGPLNLSNSLHSMPATPTPNHSRRELDEATDSSRPEDTATTSRRDSMDLPQTFGNNHVGPTSGVSFLYGQWGKGTDSEPKTANQGDDSVGISNASLVSWGDLSQIDHVALSALPEPAFTNEQILHLLDRYFESISPTYRFLHHHTVKRWALALVSRGRLTAPQRAVVLLVCAQTLLHGPTTPDQQDVVGRGDDKLSMTCSETAKVLLNNEPGPPSLASVQARIGLCLYFLSTFRLNECRYCFSFAVTVATTLGIHRRQSSASKVSTLDAESRKRTFWSLYVLDGYLSVMLGRPRLLRDEDIDQPYPSNIADADLMSSECVEDLPRHGDLEAFISHAKLAKLMARGNDQLYPLYPLSNDQLLQRSNEMLDALSQWQDDLPKFLQARKKTFTGQRTFERQNTILKLAWAHARILATRRCLLIDFSHNPSQSQDVQAKLSIQECISAIMMVLETVKTLIENGQCYRSFWSTQYIAIVAISTLYVLIIQGVRLALPGNIGNFLNVEEFLEKARSCHDHLATLPPPGSQSQRHHVLLSHLRNKAERSFANVPPRGTSIAVQQPTGSDQVSRADLQSTDVPAGRASIANSIDPNNGDVFNSPDAPNDMSMFGSMLTPNSSSDNTSFQYMLDFGWESLDTIGASMRGSEGGFGLGL